MSYFVYNLSRRILNCRNCVPCCYLTLLRCYSKRGPTDLKGRKTGAQKWLVRQMTDPYVKMARQESYRCRSAFKLLEMDDKYGFLKPGLVVIDCGAAPGSWSQVAVERVNVLGADPKKPRGQVISVDLQHMSPIIGATVLHSSDFTNAETQQKILKLLSGRRADVILSDMAPPATGIKSLDHQQIMQLAYCTLRFALVALAEGGTLVVKLLQSELREGYEAALKKCFVDVRIVKPHASRMDSAEMFILAQQFHLEKMPSTTACQANLSEKPDVEHHDPVVTLKFCTMLRSLLHSLTRRPANEVFSNKVAAGVHPSPAPKIEMAIVDDVWNWSGKKDKERRNRERNLYAQSSAMNVRNAQKLQQRQSWQADSM